MVPHRRSDVDRMGDTFRCKGEKVSTSEVADVISRCLGVGQAVVFGASLPGHDGRVGVAAITRTPEFNFERLIRHLADNLPHYARPPFVRLCERLDVNGTFKFVKGALVRDGLVEASAIGELWFLDHRAGLHASCDKDLLGRIWAGTIRV